IAATRFGSVPAARAGLAAFAVLADFAAFALAGAVLFFAGCFFLALGAMGAKTIAWRKERRATCGTPSRDGCAGFFLGRTVPRKFSLRQGSRTPDRSQIRLPRAALPGLARPRGPSRWRGRVLVSPAQLHKRSAPSIPLRSYRAALGEDSRF